MALVKDEYFGKTLRKSFAKYQEILEMPNLLKIQKDSYNWFLEEGLHEVFRDTDAITDYTGNLELSFLDYTMNDKPKYTVEECKERDATYARPIKVRVRLRNKETGEIKEQEIFMGDFPMMTNGGTFVINGAERVIVSQIVRSPGMYYGDEVDKADQHTYTATVIPYRGAWLEYEADPSNVFSVRIDKNRKLPITCLIRALGVDTDQKILDLFGEDPLITATLEKDTCHSPEDSLLEIYRKLRPGEPPTVDNARSYLDALLFDDRRYDVSKVGRYKFNKKMDLWSRLAGNELAAPIADPMTGEILFDAGRVLTRAEAHEVSAHGVNEAVLKLANGKELKVFSNGMADMSRFVSFDPKTIGIKEKVDFATLRTMLDKAAEENWDEEEWKFAVEDYAADLLPKHITPNDILASINYLICVSNGVGSTDDIDHLGNRRLRCVGELLQNQFRVGFTRLERVIRERMTVQDLETVTPQSLINIRPVTAVIKEFFGSSPLSQFMDQNNPLAELTHKRRLSALGPGGLSRERASFDVRDVHYSHYGRMCPIETPEGPNIGLINYLACFAKINEYGFVEAPFRKLEKVYDENGKYVGSRLTDEVQYMTADVEDDYRVAQANEPVDENGFLVNARVTCRHRNEIIAVDREQIDFMDVSPKMMVSVATAFIPFLQNDDANRALMGANMQRQAVPLMVTEAPIVATGVEHKCAVDSEVCLKAEGTGVVTRVSADWITIRYESGEVRDYKLTKFARSNQGTCINQRPIVEVGEQVTDGQIIADGPACSQGEISLGKNVLIGFMTWEGYNYEDAILLNERLVREDVFTSIHIEEYETEARDTKLGAEEITRDIPNVGEDTLKDLDEDGIIRIGAEVVSGDYLVGKVTPKGETELTAEERLLRAIFGEKAREVRDSSLKVPHGESSASARSGAAGAAGLSDRDSASVRSASRAGCGIPARSRARACRPAARGLRRRERRYTAACPRARLRWSAPCAARAFRRRNPRARGPGNGRPPAGRRRRAAARSAPRRRQRGSPLPQSWLPPRACTDRRRSGRRPCRTRRASPAAPAPVPRSRSGRGRPRRSSPAAAACAASCCAPARAPASDTRLRARAPAPCRRRRRRCPARRSRAPGAFQSALPRRRPCPRPAASPSPSGGCPRSARDGSGRGPPRSAAGTRAACASTRACPAPVGSR
ncbi:MAG: DNA-directed RNA polymerase subunit beta [Oscillospiraceae bacterium]|nr:DNA-directed RNA polymerase subunit beta [Oscillospiraceae bacterium]